MTGTSVQKRIPGGSRLKSIDQARAHIAYFTHKLLADLATLLGFSTGSRCRQVCEISTPSSLPLWWEWGGTDPQ